MAFELLNEKTKEWLKEKGYHSESLPQKLAIPKILEGENVLIISPTGMGKTLAAVMPIFEKILNKEEGINALYITPLKSLNRDLFEKIVNLADKLSLTVDIRHGDTSQKSRKLQREDPSNMLVITPETLQSILIGKKMREHLKNVRFIIIDEIHELVCSKRGTQLALGLERLKELTGQSLQFVCLSATIGNPEEVSKFFGTNFKIINAISSKEYDIKIEIPPINRDGIELAKQINVDEKTAQSLLRIKELIEKHESTIIFVNTRERAEFLGSLFKKWLFDFPIAVHHSSLSKEVRIDVEEKFRKGELKAIISTSSLELGIDIGEIDLIIQYNSPRQVTKLIQRIGRSGHGLNRISKGVIICNSIEDFLETKAILEKKDEKWLEKNIIYEAPLDVLCHQIIGLCCDYGKISKEKIYDIIKRAYPYRNLSYEKLIQVLDFMEEISLIRLQNEEYFRTKKGLLYYLNNLSMIPNEMDYIVINQELNKKIGLLHQNFVIQNLKINKSFIMKGESWKVMEMDKNIIKVIPSKDIEGAVPSWEGELIPVHKEVAERAANLRKTENFSELKLQKEKFIIPDEKTIFIEHYEDMVIMHSCFGNKINETFSKILGALITSKIGTSINTKVDAYRIIFKIPYENPEVLLKDSLIELQSEWVYDLIKKSIIRTSLFETRFFNISKRFGVISKNAEYSSIAIQKMLDFYKDSILYEEALKEVLEEKLDINECKEIIKAIQNQKIKVILSSSNQISPLGIEGLQYIVHSLIKPSEKIKEVINIIEERIENNKWFFCCMNCKSEIGTFKVKDIPIDFKCPFCTSKLLGFVKEKYKNIAKKVIKKKEIIKEEEKEVLKNLLDTSELFIVYGKEACFVMSGYGIGPTTAKRILGKWIKDKKELIKEIINAERNFIETKRYWKV